MTPANRTLFAHLALSVGRYANELRRDGVHPPDDLLRLGAFFADCATVRPDATPSAVTLDPEHGGPMTTATLTKREAAAELRCSVRTLERLLADSEVSLAAVSIAGSVRIRRADLDAYVAALSPRPFRDQMQEKSA